MAVAGEADAQASLGDCYYYGKGIEKNTQKAVFWYKKAAEQNNLSGFYSLGYCYINNEGVPKNDKNNEIGFTWHKKAAIKRYTNAQYELGYCYEHGLGTPVDKSEAVKWFKRATAQGHKEAQSKLGTYGKGETKISPSEEKNEKEHLRLSKHKHHRKENISIGDEKTKKPVAATFTWPSKKPVISSIATKAYWLTRSGRERKVLSADGKSEQYLWESVRKLKPVGEMEFQLPGGKVYHRKKEKRFPRQARIVRQ